jgi:hypothetical protein
MKKSLISLMEGAPSKFFDDVRAKLAEKASNICEAVASEVAPEVFEESTEADRDEDKVAFANANIKDNIQNKTPEKIKNKKAVSTMSSGNKQVAKEEVEPVSEDMGAHTISTSRKGKTFTTFVVNKKRRSAADKDRSWKNMIMKATPKETEWDKHVKSC